VALQWDIGKNDTFEFGGEKWTSVISQKMGEMRKMAKKSCDWQKKKASQISASGTFDKWLQKRNQALKPILREICSNSYSDWKRAEWAIFVWRVQPCQARHILIKHITQWISIFVQTYENETPKKSGLWGSVLYWWLVTSPYGSSKNDCARENPVGVQICTAPPRASSKTIGLPNMSRQFVFASPLRDIQDWKSNSARRHGSTARQVTARGWRTSRYHGDAVS